MELMEVYTQLGSFYAKPNVYVWEFCYLSQACDLTWHDLCAIWVSTLTL